METTPIRHKIPQNEYPNLDYSFRLSQKQIQEIKSVFDLFDSNLAGSIRTDDVGNAMRGLGLIPSEGI